MRSLKLIHGAIMAMLLILCTIAFAQFEHRSPSAQVIGMASEQPALPAISPVQAAAPLTEVRTSSAETLPHWRTVKPNILTLPLAGAFSGAVRLEDPGSC